MVAYVGSPGYAYGQTYHQLRGSIKDNKGDLLPGANIQLYISSDSLYTSSDKIGAFHFEEVRADSFRLRISFVGFKTFTHKYGFGKKKRLRLDPIQLKQRVLTLDEVTITSSSPITIKQDTISYDVSQYWLRPGSQAADLVKKLPGLYVNSEGKLTLFGEEISGIRVNGEEYFGGNLTTALNNLPASIIEKLQVIDDYGELADFTGVKVGKAKKIINLVTNTNHGRTIRPHAALGSKKRYLADGTVHVMRGSQEISGFGSVHNLSFNPFRSQFFGQGIHIVSGGNRFGGTNNRHTRHVDTGVNYKDKFSDHTKMNGSYKFSRDDQKHAGRTETQTLFDGFTNIENRTSNRETDRGQHNLNYRLSFQPDSMDKVIISPHGSLSNSDNSSESSYHIEQHNDDTPRIIEGTSRESSRGTNTHFIIPLQYIRRFDKKGRSFSVNLNAGVTQGKTDRQHQTTSTTRRGNQAVQSNNIHQMIKDRSSGVTTVGALQYTEPLAKQTVVDVTYNSNYDVNNQDQTTFDTDEGNLKIDSLSQSLKNHTLSSQLGLSFRRRTKHYQLMTGLSLENKTIKGTEAYQDVEVKNSAITFQPNVRFTYMITASKILRFNFRRGANLPGFSQLKPVTDNSNPQYPVVGNPDLKPSHSNNISFGYRTLNYLSGNFFSIRLGYSSINDQVVSNTITAFDDNSPIIQETRYRNADGNRDLTANVGLGRAIIGKKLALQTRGTFGLMRNVSFYNSEKNIGKTFSWSQDLRVKSVIPHVLDASLIGYYFHKKLQYAGPSRADQTVSSFGFRLSGKNYFFKDLVLGYHFSKSLYNSFKGSSRPATLNMSLKYEFLKNNKASLSLRAIDLLNETDGATRGVLGNTITDSFQDDILSRYFLLSFSLRLQHYNKK